VFRDGPALPLSAFFVQETTVFRDTAASGSTMRLGGYEPNRGWAGEPHLRRGCPLLPAARHQRRPRHARSRFRSAGENARHLYFGGNSEMRGYDYLEFVGQNVLFANAELRFPHRGGADADRSSAACAGALCEHGRRLVRQPAFTFATASERYTPIVGYERDP
jgi:hypothetical protein